MAQALYAHMNNKKIKIKKKKSEFLRMQTKHGTWGEFEHSIKNTEYKKY
jgi:hypothetical protein